MISRLLLCLALLAGSLAAKTVDIDPAQAVLVVEDQAQRGVLPPAVAAAERAHYQQLVQPSHALRNLVWTLAGILLCVSSIALFYQYLWMHLKNIPPEVYEVLFWLTCFGVVAAVWQLGPAQKGLAALPGLLGMIGALGLSLRLHAPNWFREHGLKLGQLAAGFLAVVWSLSAILLHSELVGWLAALGMLGALGFITAAGAGQIGVGFNSAQIVPFGTAGAMLMAAIGLLIHTSAGAAEPWCWLLPGIGKLGAIGGLLGLLVVSSQLYRQWLRHRVFWNLVTLATLLGFCGLGDWLGDPFLKQLGATMTVLFLIEKYVENVWRRLGWLWGLFGLGGFLWGLFWVLSRYPGLFVLN